MPPSTKARLKNSADLYEEFTGHNATFYTKQRVNWPETAANIGEITGIMYRTKRDGRYENYLHEFKKRSRPRLGVSGDGKQFIAVGGKYRFTDSGFIDQ